MKKDTKFHNEALTFDDVLLVPAYSQIIPSETNVRTSLTKNINLNIPLLSASMDTVTESNLAIALALKGGIGIIHKNMSIDNQCNEIRRVKRSQSGMIKDPITMHTDATVKDALQIMKKHQIGGIPIINSSKEDFVYDLKGKRIPVNPCSEYSASDLLNNLIDFQENDKNKAYYG